MSEILTDSAVTNLLITNSFYHNSVKYIDSNGNVSFPSTSIRLGSNINSTHENSIVLNTSNIDTTTNIDNSIVFNSLNGIIFSLPNESSILFDNIPNGFGCWCWNDSNNLVLKTKQNDINYTKTLT